jgi:hypothetical protein
MKPRLIALLLLALVISSALAASPADPAESSPKPAPLPGVQLAHVLATATGIAISPMLGVSTVGAWRWWRAAAEERAGLDWFCSPWVWGPGLLFTLLLLLKEPVLGAVPPLKKPFDALEVLESKVSAFVAAPAVLPMFLSALGAVTSLALLWEPVVATPLALGGAAWGGAALAVPAPLAMLGYGLAACVFMVGFFVVWLAFHAINVLILLSPFGFLDMFLRSIKLFVLATLLTATWLSPWLGVAVVALILLVSLPIAAWSLRLTAFGWVVAWDLIRRRHRQAPESGTPIRAFTATRALGAPNRALGLLTRDGDTLVFSYRPWLVLRSRRVTLPAAPITLERGLVCPLVRRADVDNDAELFRLPPRYRSHETHLAEELVAVGVLDAPVLRGLRAVLAWARQGESGARG